MEARILKWRELTKTKQVTSEAFESMQQELKLRDAEQARQQRIDQLIKQIPMRFRGKTLTDYIAENDDQIYVKGIAERYIETTHERMAAGTSICFMGRPGTGKTLLSLIMYQAIISKGFHARYESSLEFLKGLIEIKFKSQTNFEREIQKLRDIPFLIIDEVTESVSRAGKPTEIEKQLLFRIINDRYENRLSTLIITNKDEEGLVDSLGEPIVDRIKDGGFSLAFNWNSYRK
jgi:DNA replication protein DnaC